MASVLEPPTRKRRKWLRWAVLLNALLGIATAGGVWWARPRAAPLTAEEQSFVGYWELAVPRSGSMPTETVAHEFRADRKVIYHRRDPRTGARTAEDTGIRWRAGEGKFFYITWAPRPPFGLFTQPADVEMQVTWDGPDRIRMSVVHHGPGGAATDTFLRRPGSE